MEGFNYLFNQLFWGGDSGDRIPISEGWYYQKDMGDKEEVYKILEKFDKYWLVSNWIYPLTPIIIEHLSKPVLHS